MLSLLGALSPIGLILSVIAFMQAGRAGAGSGLALAGAILGPIGTAVFTAVTIYSIVTIGQSTELCSVTDLVDGTCR